jgi:hypothetical protein
MATLRFELGLGSVETGHPVGTPARQIVTLAVGFFSWLPHSVSGHGIAISKRGVRASRGVAPGLALAFRIKFGTNNDSGDTDPHPRQQSDQAAQEP